MIDFLSPAWLLAGLAAAVPLFIHLMRRRIGTRIEFPAVRYLARAEREHSRKLRLKNLLLMLLRRRDRASLADAAACGGGALIGLLAILLPYLAAPQALLYGVFEYGADAPFHWYQLNGTGHRLGLDWKLIDTAAALARGPALVALALVAWSATRPSSWP